MQQKIFIQFVNLLEYLPAGKINARSYAKLRQEKLLAEEERITDIYTQRQRGYETGCEKNRPSYDT
jgi:hypothetical protein